MRVHYWTRVAVCPIAVGHEVEAEDLTLLVRRYQVFGGESFHECAKGSEL